MKKNESSILSQLIDIYYGESDMTLEALSQESGMPLEVLQQHFDQFHDMQASLNNWGDEEPSSLSVNKILAHARDRQPKRKFSWSFFKIPALASGFAMILLTVVAFQTGLFEEEDPLMAWESAKPSAYANPYAPSAYGNGTGYNSFSKARPVSVGENRISFYDDQLNKKLMSRSMTLKDLESLLFRARKSERQGNFQGALQDYQYVAEFYPQVVKPDDIHLAIARCFEGLGRSNEAVNLLTAFARKHGTTPDINRYLDELRSETF